jgi:crotonobetainyl-CoA:carnitine CoA-transferase CaiB-like acyl-CoA transferase
MTAILTGVRILEVAEHTFVPAASAMLADLGAEVIKIEHVERGDAMRGHQSAGMTRTNRDVHALLEHSNRGKRSLGLDLSLPDGRDILYRLAAASDVFLTNKLPRVRAKLGITLDRIRAANPRIIYVCGTGQGERGPDADKGAYDSLAFWARSGIATAVKRPEYDLLPLPPGPGFGDSIGAMTIAGGIMGALFYRERTGQPTTVDVSLLATALWAMGQSASLSLLAGEPFGPGLDREVTRNPLSRVYRTKGDRYVALTCLHAGTYWKPLCDIINRPDLATDARFADHAALIAHTFEAVDALTSVFAEETADEWRRRLESFPGQWTIVQDVLEACEDPQTIANGYLQDCHTAAGAPFKLVAPPVQYDGQPCPPHRAPEFNEHGDQILQELGIEWDDVVALKLRGVVA